jgi:hypothetical protein
MCGGANRIGLLAGGWTEKDRRVQCPCKRDTNNGHKYCTRGTKQKFDCFFTATSLQASFVSIKWGYHIHRGHANILEGTPILVAVASPIQVFLDPSSLFTKHYSKDFELASLRQNHSQQYIRS